MKLKKLDVCIEAGNFEIEAFDMEDESFTIEVIDSADIIVESHNFENAWEGLEIMKRLIKKYEKKSKKNL